MRTVEDPATLANLTARLERLDREQKRVWGRMSAHQMAVHLADVAEAVLLRREFGARARRGNSVMRILALYAPIPWPRDIRTGANPASVELAPEFFELDRTRAITTLIELTGAPVAALATRHPIFGPMTRRDWHRWAYLHVDHHLRQFGL